MYPLNLTIFDAMVWVVKINFNLKTHRIKDLNCAVVNSGSLSIVILITIGKSFNVSNILPSKVILSSICFINKIF